METHKAAKDKQNHKEHVGGEPGRFMHSEDPTVHGYSRCWFCSIFSLSSFTQCWGQTGLAGRFLQCPLPWKHRCWWSIYSDASLWLSEVAPFRSDIRHWSKVLPLPSWKPFSPTQCPKPFTSHSMVSPLIRLQAKEMCPNWTCGGYFSISFRTSPCQTYRSAKTQRWPLGSPLHPSPSLEESLQTWETLKASFLVSGKSSQMAQPCLLKLPHPLSFLNVSDCHLVVQHP